jgi:hypothetical protein
MRNRIKHLSLIGILFISICCGCGKKPASVIDSLSGGWSRYVGAGTRIGLAFTKDGKYDVYFEKRKQDFPGTYTVIKSTMQLVDTYCGTKLPGVYEFSVKNDELHMKALDDKFCDRDRFFNGIWKRDSSAIPPPETSDIEQGADETPGPALKPVNSLPAIKK